MADKAQFKLKDVVPARFYGNVLVDTSYTFEGYYETMVFEIDRLTGVPCMSRELDVKQYANEDQAAEGHAKMVEKWRTR